MTGRSKTKSEQKTVKAFDADIAWINEEAKARGCVAAEVIHDLCEQARRRSYLQDLSESFDALSHEAELMAAFRAENAEWDATLSDGLNDAT
ncbi:MAG: hypothetical protein K2Z81_11580 [Cyanobacteria bacterium]|nr:hypothetical protein [Cyanobacteriota bacterium]